MLQHILTNDRNSSRSSINQEDAIPHALFNGCPATVDAQERIGSLLKGSQTASLFEISCQGIHFCKTNAYRSTFMTDCALTFL